MKTLLLLLGLALCCKSLPLQAQTTAEIADSSLQKATALADKASHLPTAYLNDVSRKADKLQERLNRSSRKALRSFSKQQQKIYRKLAKVDSAAANNFLTQNMGRLQSLQNSFSGKATAVTDKLSKLGGFDKLTTSGGYFPYLDTLKNALGFLQNKGSSYLGQARDLQNKLSGSLDQVQAVEDRLDQVNQLQQTLQQQQQQLMSQLQQYDFLQKDLLKLNKTAYYYAARVKNYKELFHDPKKAEAEALKQLRKLPAFNRFMQEHSALAGLFRLPAGYGSPGGNTPDLQGLQTRAMVEQEIQQRLAGGGPNAQQQLSQQMQAARQKLQELKDKLPGGGSTAEMPNFKPNELKSKTFLQRLDFGGNLQFARSGTYFPTTSDLAGQVAYRLTEKGSVGVGAAFKLGWGTSIQKIHFTAQGLGLRSFIDYKLKGSFYANGGFEFQYNKTIPDIPALHDLNGWTKSALLGIEKKYKISNKMEGNVMLLFDFLYKQHVPQTQPLVFRIGYNFR